jgi:hypothetical protein
MLLERDIQPLNPIDKMILEHALVRHGRLRVSVYFNQLRGVMGLWEIRVSDPRRNTEVEEVVGPRDFAGRWDDRGRASVWTDAIDRAARRLLPWAGKLRRIATRPLVRGCR